MKSSDAKKKSKLTKYRLLYQKNQLREKNIREEEEKQKRNLKLEMIKSKMHEGHARLINRSYNARHKRKQLLNLLTRNKKYARKASRGKRVVKGKINNYIDLSKRAGESEKKSISSQSPRSKFSLGRTGNFKIQGQFTDRKRESKEDLGEKEEKKLVRRQTNFSINVQQSPDKVEYGNRRQGLISRTTSVFDFTKEKKSIEIKQSVINKGKKGKKKRRKRFHYQSTGRLMEIAKEKVGDKKELIDRMRDRNDMMKAEKDGNEFFGTLNRIIKRDKPLNFGSYKVDCGSEGYLKLREFYSKQLENFKHEDTKRELRLRMKDIGIENLKLKEMLLKQNMGGSFLVDEGDVANEESEFLQNSPGVVKFRRGKRNLSSKKAHSERRKVASVDLPPRMNPLGSKERNCLFKTSLQYSPQKIKRSEDIIKSLTNRAKAQKKQNMASSYHFKNIQNSSTRSKKWKERHTCSTKKIRRKARNLYSVIQNSKIDFFDVKEKKVINTALENQERITNDFLKRLKNINNLGQIQNRLMGEVKKLKEESMDNQLRDPVITKKKNRGQVAFALGKNRSFKISIGGSRRKDQIVV